MMKIHKYNSSYVKFFKNERKRLYGMFGDMCQIEHIGSTAIPGTDGKGVIDILLMFDNNNDVATSVKKLIDFGYFLSPYRPERNGRIFMTSSGSKDSVLGDIHLHLLTKNNDECSRLILFRNYLINHENARRAYNDLKYEILKKVNGDRKQYTKLKDEFIKQIIKDAQNEMLRESYFTN